MLRGSCLCGAVRFSVNGELEGGDACHCIQCRKHSGHYFASTDIPKAAFKIDGEDQLAWYQSSDRVRRGFCRSCGSSLFWDPMASEKIAVAMGAFDDPTGTRLHMHIFTSEKGDYYEIADGLPQHDR
jgi:hypothetical protein